MAAEFIRLYEQNPDPKRVRQVVDVLRNGGIIIYPTDTVYGMGCDITNQRAVERICKIKGINPKKHNFSFVCADLSNISQYTRVITKPVFKMMKKGFPGPFTFILEASSLVPKILHSNKKTVGIRVPDHSISRAIVEELGQPILSTSIHDEDEVVEYSTDPELIFEKYQNLVDIVIDGGYGQNVASTILDCTGDEVEIIRQGLGQLEDIV
ncbi:MAG: L-threonylcarbamoyladenylate synthase [Algoriphagus sp.]|jgi:tRNA threonylcarbamoyl adenosine modification protein (Sua5/YciO/YrdC/YwlC family)|uniref:L-threonylcarbamoyladenylate synthase n=1 Tax=Algoriphagus sp. TaxID=1872435 RepID=UPI0027183BFF|nr:L-threonylcarbamoyladenylate synthase [Algoriphagus sp.]MDO8969005.1 L-threonylcarbamoyladenylate synthase [Algoriphagus sp.]MDP2041402.1 L-threonylcarbamoyladenylate synthase [Algoriphagus sp.]MDP3200235.1 L-threonylcarbamoyladenylate synthase [Algoriphagus sp.]MDP3473708.1 L-threonylcarbamoyladenylate synthase [Algoriphagus sp.]